MKISAQVTNSQSNHQIILQTGNHAHSISIPPKTDGFGSSASGGELLFLALATCYCNDIYREASKSGVKIEKVEVEVSGDFGAVGEPATNISYRAKVSAQASEETIHQLMVNTDSVAEIHNTLRIATPVTLNQVEVVSI